MTPPAARIHIPQPCSESWDAMTPTATGRHCAACQKTVVDFTWKTDAEILAILRQAAGETCGRLHADQLNRPLLLEVMAASPESRWRTWLAAALALWVARESSSLEAEARTGPTSSGHHASTNTRGPRHSALASKLLHGTVRDAATHEPLANVAVFLKGENRATTTNATGQFSLQLPAGRAAARRPRLVLHHAGHLSRQLLVAPTAGAVQVALYADPAAAGVEVIAAYREQRRETVSGAISQIIAAEPPAAQPSHGFFHWLTRPFRRR